MTLRDKTDALDTRQTAAHWDEWFDKVMHTPQEMRLMKSGLKPEPGAFERSVFLMERAEGKWQRSVVDVARDRKKLAVQRRKNTIAREAIGKIRRPFIKPGDTVLFPCGHSIAHDPTKYVHCCRVCGGGTF